MLQPGPQHPLEGGVDLGERLAPDPVSALVDLAGRVRVETSESMLSAAVSSSEVLMARSILVPPLAQVGEGQPADGAVPQPRLRKTSRAASRPRAAASPAPA